MVLFMTKENTEMSPMRTAALALFAAALNAVLKGVPLNLGPKPSVTGRVDAKPKRENKSPIPPLNSDVLSRPLPSLRQPPSNRRLGKKQTQGGGRALAQ